MVKVAESPLSEVVPLIFPALIAGLAVTLCALGYSV